MTFITKLPMHWSSYYQSPAYFITYYGDIYYGYFYECPRYNDRIYIAQKDKANEIKALKAENNTLDNYQLLSREIKDIKIISQYDPIEDSKLGLDVQFTTATRTGQKWKKMFVFGAGASAFCTFNDNNALRNYKLKPPTGYEIFDDCYKEFYEKYPAADISIPEFIVAGNDIEECLQKEWESIRDSYNPKVVARHINIQYYLQELFQTISKEVISNFSRTNLYSLFASRLQKYLTTTDNEQVGLVSFNYDTVLDNFIDKAFKRPNRNTLFESLSDYIDYSNNPFLFFKPHGSANWGWKFREERLTKFTGNLPQYLYDNEIDLATIYYHLLGDISEMVVSNSWGLETELHKNRLGRYTLNKNRIEVIQENQHYYPSLLLPYRDKDEFTMPYDHQLTLKYFMHETEELYLIGWKGNEDVFNRLFENSKERLKRIVIVNPNEREKKEVSDNLSKYFGNIYEKYEVIVIDTFEDFVLNHMENLLIPNVK